MLVHDYSECFRVTAIVVHVAHSRNRRHSDEFRHCVRGLTLRNMNKGKRNRQKGARKRELSDRDGIRSTWSVRFRFQISPHCQQVRSRGVRRSPWQPLTFLIRILEVCAQYPYIMLKAVRTNQEPHCASEHAVF